MKMCCLFKACSIETTGTFDGIDDTCKKSNKNIKKKIVMYFFEMT